MNQARGAKADPNSLLDILKQRFESTIDSVRSGWKILVVDQVSQQMLYSVIKQYDILEKGVQRIDLITSQRSPQPQLDAIYILMPTSQNVQLIVKDFVGSQPPPSKASSSKKGKEQPPTPVEAAKYAAAHIYFLDGLADDLADWLMNSIPERYLRALTDLYINLHAVEPRVFTLKSPNSFKVLYAPPDRTAKESVEQWDQEISWMSRGIVNALATLGEYPLIRYYNPPSSFHPPLGPAASTGQNIGKVLADRVQAEMDVYARNNRDFPPVEDPPRPRGILFITDRSMDLYAPFLHEFTYQAMCNDLLDIEDGSKYFYTFRNANGDREEKEASLTEEDRLWGELRHMHMKDALEKVVSDFKTYAAEHGGRYGGNSTNLNDMKDMLASLSQMKDTKDQLSLHLTMAQSCMSVFENRKLALAAIVEQCCSTGVTADGKTPKTLVEDMVTLLDDRSVSGLDKLRIIAIYVMYRDGVPDGDKKRLYQHARLALHEMDSVDNLSFLGANVSKDAGKKRKPLFKHKEEADAYDISRYAPAVQSMLEEHFANKLDTSIFPYVRDAPTGNDNRLSTSTTTGSLRSAKPQWTARKAPNEPRQRVIVFVAGGMTYSEIRAAYKLSSNESVRKEVYIGSTSVLTPELFVKQLGSLNRGTGGTPDPNKYADVKKQGKNLVAKPSEVSQKTLDDRFGAMSVNDRASPPQPYGQPQPSRPAPSRSQPGSYGRDQPPPPSSGYRQSPPGDYGRQPPPHQDYGRHAPAPQMDYGRSSQSGYSSNGGGGGYPDPRGDPRGDPRYDGRDSYASSGGSGGRSGYAPGGGSAVDDRLQQKKRGLLSKR